MAKTPYTKEINPNTIDSHQTSPAYMLTVIRWRNRDTFNYEGDAKATRAPLVIYNDAISVTVSNTKSNVTSSMSARLLAGDLNYATAIHPGDFVMVNMVNWNDKVSVVDGNGREVGANTLRARVAAQKPINSYNDGFKGIFRIQKVSKVLKTDPASGVKAYYYEMQAFGFTELNTVIYYDPQIFNQLQGNFRFFMQQFDGFFGGITSKKENNKVQDILPVLISALIGQGTKAPNNKLKQPQNVHFELPDLVGRLLGVKNIRYAAELFNYYIGIWQASSGGAQNPESGFNPKITRNTKLPSGFYTTGKDLQGRKVVEAEYWNNVKVWDILSKYANTLINEMYTTYRVNPNGRVMPSLVIRQKPFTSEHFNSQVEVKRKYQTGFKNTPTTKYMDLPRWRLNPSMVFDMNLGKDEAARINFVQVYTRTVAANDARNRARQTGTGNYQFDVDDIKRSGLKPYLATADFDYPENGDKSTKGKEWANLVADWVIDGHLRESGTLSCVGIQDPISVGDNIEFDGIIYHIEAISHTINVDPRSGRKVFRTNLNVSFGTDPRSDKTRPVYAEMDHQDALTKRIEDYDPNTGERILPGFSDTQNIVGRKEGEETKETRGGSYGWTQNPKKRKNTVESYVKGEQGKDKKTSKDDTNQDSKNFTPIDPSKE